MQRTLSSSLLSPFSVLMVIYFAYFALVFSEVYRYAYWDLMNLGTRVLGFHPLPVTIVLYVYGAVVIACGFLGGLIVARRVFAVPAGNVSRAVLERLARLWRGLATLPGLRAFGTAYALSVAGWLASFGANVLQDVVGGVGLTDIATRWSQSPILVFVALGQIFFVPATMVAARSRRQLALSAALFFVSVAALATLGARHLPAKLIVAAFLAAVYVLDPKHLWRLAAGFLLLLLIALGVVGAMSKQGIYGAQSSARLALGLTYSDSASTISNLDRIVQMTPSTGAFHGTLLRDSILAGVPRTLFKGPKPDYANYQIGRYLGGRKFFVIGDTVINRSVSLAPTLLGAAYADLGVPGVVAQMLLLGLLFGYLQARAPAARWLIPFLVTYASYVVHAVNVGVHSPQTLAAIASAIAVVALDATLGRAAAGSRPVPKEQP